jgi:hypothetical protein
MEWNAPEWLMPAAYVSGGFIAAVLFLYLLAVVSGVNRD